ncbi:MAG: hypothetical protein CVT92_13295 [Bacteroidetes bacterium HGW-Bacteroidetes-1]|jgi:hypothetical protein|nr:MAG: hypothetical protein CVT92_13295 [Bacteroidetes bacterium HGW-Bacteroidetes-1]
MKQHTNKTPQGIANASPAIVLPDKQFINKYLKNDSDSFGVHFNKEITATIGFSQSFQPHIHLKTPILPIPPLPPK